MTATIYGRGQMVIPAKARKEARLAQGDVLDVRTEGDGRILLVRLEAPRVSAPAKARLVRRKGSHAVIVGARKVSDAELRAALSEFP